jgi:hypothetical protein
MAPSLDAVIGHCPDGRMDSGVVAIQQQQGQMDERQQHDQPHQDSDECLELRCAALGAVLVCKRHPARIPALQPESMQTGGEE